MSPTIRPLKPGDIEPVTSFTADTWPAQDYDDYVPTVLPEWAQSDDPDRHTMVATENGSPVGLLRTVLLTSDESWQQGMRVHPDYRGDGIGQALTHEGFAWARDQGAAVARNMVFGWNDAGLGLSRAAGFEPTTSVCRTNPEPRAVDTAPEITVDVGAAWQFWNASTARTHLQGLAFDPEESWAVSLLTRDRLARAAENGGLFVVKDNGVRGFAIRTRVIDRKDERLAEYGVAAWADADGCKAVFDAIANDAASREATECRVIVPGTVEVSSDVALVGVPTADEIDYVLSADLTAAPWDD